jgi:transposase InsO family protein
MTKYLKLIEKNIKGKHLIIWHSDNGDEYTDEKTKILFNKYKVQQSFTDKESSFQNGTVEGFFSQLSRHIYLRKLLDSNTTNDKIKKLATEFIALYNKRIEDTQKKNNFKYVYDKEINKRHRWYVQNFLNFSF